MRNYTKGDRVAVYNSNGRSTGTVMGMASNDGAVSVKLDDFHYDKLPYYHPKQLRRLKKKEKVKEAMDVRGLLNEALKALETITYCPGEYPNYLKLTAHKTLRLIEARLSKLKSEG